MIYIVNQQNNEYHCTCSFMLLICFITVYMWTRVQLDKNSADSGSDTFKDSYTILDWTTGRVGTKHTNVSGKQQRRGHQQTFQKSKEF